MGQKKDKPMTKEEFFDTLDELLRSTITLSNEPIHYLTNRIDILLESAPLNDENQTYLTEYLVNPNCQQPDYNQILGFWYLADRFNNVPLMDTLIELNGGKVDYDLLTYLLEQSWYTAFQHAIQLYDDNHDKLYDLINNIIFCYEPPVFNDQAINYLLNIAQPQSLPKQNLSNLLYNAITYNLKMAEALIRHGYNPFGDYWEEDVNTGVPILFAIVQGWEKLESYEAFNFIQQHNDTQEWWNTTDQWERNLLHFAVESKNLYDLLIEKGVDPNHQALIDDEEKVTLAKIKGTLPKDYGKTPREIQNSYYDN